MSRAVVDLSCRGAGHQASLFSTDRPEVLRKASLEDSSSAGKIGQVMTDRGSVCSASPRSARNERCVHGVVRAP